MHDDVSSSTPQVQTAVKLTSRIALPGRRQENGTTYAELMRGVLNLVAMLTPTWLVELVRVPVSLLEGAQGGVGVVNQLIEIVRRVVRRKLRPVLAGDWTFRRSNDRNAGAPRNVRVRTSVGGPRGDLCHTEEKQRSNSGYAGKFKVQHRGKGGGKSPESMSFDYGVARPAA